MLAMHVLANCNFGDLADIVSQITLVCLALIGGFFAIRVFFSVFTGQISMAGGRPGAVADSLIEIISSILLLAIAYQAPAIGERAGALFCNRTITSGEAVVQALMDVAINPLLMLFSSLAVATAIVAVVFAAFRSQIANLIGGGYGLAESMMSAFGAIMLFTLGIVAIRVAMSMFV